MSNATRRPGLQKPGAERVAQATPIPAVPFRTPLFASDDPANAPDMSETWILFFEQLAGALAGVGKTLGAMAPWRTLLIYDTTVGNDIAPRLTAQASGKPLRVVGVLRAALASDLAVRINLNAQELIICTLAAATATAAPVTFTDFALPAIVDGDVFSWDVVAGSGASDAAGVAAFTIQWGLAGGI